MAIAIVISSGHGKYVRGASGYLDEVNEARRVVERVADYMRSAGVNVTTFHDDVSHSQNENLNRIVDFHNSKTRDLDVSVHFNAYETTSKAMGTECLYVSQYDLADQMATAVSQEGGLINRGPKKRTDLFFLNNTEEPAILIETCFVDSSEDANQYNDNFESICHTIAETLSGETVAPPDEVEIPDRPEPEPPPEGAIERPVTGVGDEGQWVVSIQKSLGLPPDGHFGPVTEEGVQGFQRAIGLTADGVVGPNTWESLDSLDARVAAGNDGISDTLAATIDQLVASSSLLNYDWNDRGRATSGYYAGMAKTYALAVLKLDRNDPAVAIMAQADTGNADKDALTWYEEQFADEEMDNSRSGVDTLRHLFVLMFGLGMRESSGNSWEGRDLSASNVQSDTAESGLMQSSWNLHSCSGTITSLMREYQINPNGFRATFAHNLSPTKNNLDTYGSGDGALYQSLAKFAPAFAVLMTGVGLRKLRQHWGPINRHEVELVSMVDDLLIDVERAITLDQGPRLA